MISIPIDQAKVAQARALGQKIARNVLSDSGRHTTTSIERTALRFIGVSGVAEGGAPFPNLLVSEIQRKGGLSKGSLWWLGRELLTEGSLDRVLAKAALGVAFEPTPVTSEEDLAIRETVRSLVGERSAELTRIRDGRRKFKETLSEPPQPWKYLIVATGSIFDDVVQARAAAEAGADIIAVIRSTAQSLLDYVPDGVTTEGYGGTYATQENFRVMRKALDEVSRSLGRYVRLTNYSSGLCMPEIACIAAFEGLDVLLNDAMYGILFRDINMKRTFCDQYVSRLICAKSSIIINTGEDNYLTTADAVEKAHTVLASLFINEAFAIEAGLKPELMGLGHAFEIDPSKKDQIVYEIAQALLVRGIFPDSPIKYMPPTKHKSGDIFYSHVLDSMFNLVSTATGQSIHLLGMMTEAMHNPLLMDRFESLKSANYIFNAAKSLGMELRIEPGGMIASRAQEVLEKALDLLREAAGIGLPAAIESAMFADISRKANGGKGLDGVVEKAPDYFNPVVSILEKELEVGSNCGSGEVAV